MTKIEIKISERLAQFRDCGVSPGQSINATHPADKVQSARNFYTELSHDILDAYKSGAITKTESLRLIYDLGEWYADAMIEATCFGSLRLR